MRRHNSCRWCNGHGRKPLHAVCQGCGASFCRKHGDWSTQEEAWLCSHCLPKEG